MYTDPDFKNKKALKNYLESRKAVSVYPPGLGTVPNDGEVFLEGPHYPKAHTWSAMGTMQNGKLVKVV